MYKPRRGKNKVKIDFSVPDIYKAYKKTVASPVEKVLFTELLREYNTEVLRMIVFDGMDYSISNRVGSLRIKKFDNSLRLNKQGEVANKLRPDWPKTHKRWEQLYPGKTFEELKKIPNKPIVCHLNEHSDGFVFKWYWDKVTSNLRNQSAYKFEPVRDMKRLAAKAWKTIPKLKDIYYE